MTTQPVEVPLDLTGNYTPSVQQATEVTEGLQTAVAGLTLSSGAVGRALDTMSPSRRHIAAWGGFVSAAAYWQSQTGDIRASAKATGQDLNSLERDVRSLSRQFPVGANGAVQMVRTVQSLGVTSRGAQPQVRALAADLIRLEAANSAMGSGLGESFGQLNRSMASLDPNRLARFGDVLTTVSQRTGASAMGIVGFSRQIAPMAQQAGIGETAVLGMSSAFVKLGDDGGAAATAVNKIIGDLNRSVRQGSNDMAAYAQITGMTVKNFRELYQANPAQAIAAVTTAIGNAGPGRGQQMLESLGLEGVRTQRALLQLSQSGGLQQAISQAQGAYGNGLTNVAAAAALKGLNSNLDELTSTAGQAADALGTPLLRPLSALVHLATTALGPVSGVLNSGVGQGVLSAGIYGALALRLGARAAVPGSLAALGLQAGRSGPVRGIFGGYALGRTGMDLAEAERMRVGRFGLDSATAYSEGVAYGRGPMVGVNRGATRIGTFLGGFSNAIRPYNSEPGPSGYGFGDFMRRGAMGGSMGFEAWARSFRDPFHQAFRPAGERASLLMPGRVYDPQTGQPMMGAAGQGAMATAVDRYRESMWRSTEGPLQSRLSSLGSAFHQLEKDTGGFGAALRRVGGAGLGMAAAPIGFAGRSAVGLAGGVGRGLGFLGSTALGMVGGIGGAAMLAGFGLYGLHQRSQQQDQAFQQHVSNLDIYGVLNSYRDAMGQAGVATTTLADQVQNAASRIQAAVTTLPRARTVSSEDIATAMAHRNQITHTYTGNAQQVAAEASALNLGGLQPGDIQQVKLDLLRQGRNPAEVNQILGMVQTRSHGLTGANIDQIIAGAGGGTRQQGAGTQIYRGFGNFINGNNPNEYWKSVGESKFGDFGMFDPHLSKQAQGQVDIVSGAIGQQFADVSARGGAKFGAQAALGSANRALAAAIRTHNADLVVTLERQLTKQLTGKEVKDLTAAQMAEMGPNAITNIIKQHGLSVYNYALSDVASATRSRQTPGNVTAFQGAGLNDLASLFTRSSGRAGRTIDNYLTTGADSPAALTTAVMAGMKALQQSGKSLSEIANESIRGLSQVGENTPDAALLQGLITRAQFQQQTNLIGATRAQTFGGQSQMALAMMSTNGNSAFAQQQRVQGEQNAQSTYQQMVSYYQQRLMAQYQYQVQSQRAQEDYQRNTARQEQDYFIGRRRAYEDYNIQMRRQREDAAATMYNPFERIQAKPVYDAGNLLLNMREQLQAMRQQIRNIRQLRAMGLSEAAIRTMDLYNPENAQQVLQLTMDLRSDRSLVGQFNSDVTQRERAAGQLMSESPQYKRAREDFNRSMARQQEDFTRMRQRQQEDFTISLNRMAQDIHMQDLEITNDLTTLQKEMQGVLKGQTVDFTHSIRNTLSETLALVNHYAPMLRNGLTNGGSDGGGSGPTGSYGSVNLSGGTSGGGYGDLPVGTGGRTASGDPIKAYVKPGTGAVYSGGYRSTGTGKYDYRPSDKFMRDHPAQPAYNKSIAKSMKPGWGSGEEWNAWSELWTRESGWNQYADNTTSDAYGIPQSLPGTKMQSAGRDWRTNPATQIRWGISYIAGTYGNPINALQHENRFGWYGAGGIATKPHIGVVAERGNAEAMIPLDERGAKFLASTLKQYIGPTETSSMRSAGYATYIDHSVHYHDNGVHFPGAHIEVASDDPSTFGRQAAEKARMDNLTGTRGVSWSRS